MAPEHPGGPAHGVRDVVQLEVGEHPEALVLQGIEGGGTGLGVELEAHLGHAEPRLRPAAATASAASRSPTSSASARWSRGSSSRLHPLLFSALQRPVRSRDARDVVTRAPVASSSRTRYGARGSRKVAVPTPTALAPASSISTASTPDCTPPVPMTGTPGSARVTSCTARSATGLIARTREPAATPAEHRAPGLGVDRQTRARVFTRVSPSAPGVDRGAGDRREIGHVRRELREHAGVPSVARRAPRRPHASRSDRGRDARTSAIAVSGGSGSSR